MIDQTSNQSDSFVQSKKSGNFFQNIFEFNHDHKEDTFEFKDFNVNVAEYEKKLRSISSIIEEDEDKDESDKDISYNSYPIINRKYVKRNIDANNRYIMEANNTNNTPRYNNQTSIVTGNKLFKQLIDKNKNKFRKQIQEICLQDLPMKVHPKYIQPLKHSFSDRYPCYSGLAYSEMSNFLSTKSRSCSHSQLRNVHNYGREMERPRRQDSFDEDWEENSHTSIRSSYSASKLTDSNDMVRNVSKSSMSYTSTRENPNKQAYHQFASSSKSNSNASIASSRITTNSSQHTFTKR